MSRTDHQRPAILGGVPVRPQGAPDWPRRDAAIDAAFAALLETGDWGRYHGRHCSDLTQTLAEHLQSPHALLCSSGTVAVELALRGLGVGPGDEVILSAYDFKSNFTNVLQVGARPVLVDVREDNGQLDIDLLDSAVSGQSRCVIASHLHGGMVDMAALRDWSARRGISILEDACQATGASCDARPAGALGDVGVWSFGGSKLLTCGRGGVVFTRRDDVAQRIRLQQERGNTAYPLSEMQAAVLSPQLKNLTRDHRQRSQAVAYLVPQLRRFGLEPLTLPTTAADPAYYKLGLQLQPGAINGLDRDRLVAAMRAEGIALDTGFAPLHGIHARSRFRVAGTPEHADRFAARLLTLHHPILLENDEALDQIPSALERIERCAEELLAR